MQMELTPIRVEGSKIVEIDMEKPIEENLDATAFISTSLEEEVLAVDSDEEEKNKTEYTDGLYCLAHSKGWKGTYKKFLMAKERYKVYENKLWVANVNDQILFRIMKHLPEGESYVRKEGRKRIRVKKTITSPLELIDTIIASVQSVMVITDIKADEWNAPIRDLIEDRFMPGLYKLRANINDRICNAALDLVEKSTKKDFDLM